MMDPFARRALAAALVAALAGGLASDGTTVAGLEIVRGGSGPAADGSRADGGAGDAGRPSPVASIVVLAPPSGPGPTPSPTRAPATRPPVTPRPAATPGPSAAARPAATPAPAPSAKPASTPPPLSACPIFPATNVWNERVDELPVAASSDAMIAAIGPDRGLHPDFGSYAGYGIPYNVVGRSTPRSTVRFAYDDESDHVGYPIPSSPKVEAGSDRHLLLLDTDACRLYELYDAVRTPPGGWTAGSGATWSLTSNALRPKGWTSADAAGLPIFPGLARYAEDAAGAIRHALRFTAPRTCAGYVYPARHEAGSGSCDVLPPMGLRVRLKASVDLSGYGAQARVILVALQRYGMILADNGSAWYVTGAPDPRWDDDVLHALGGIHGSDFEVVDTSGLVNG